MVQRRCKKGKDILADKKMREGYAPVNFDDFVVKGSKSYNLKSLRTVTN
jgi:hypothetical protein